jgi:hypothetical protein
MNEEATTLKRTDPLLQPFLRARAEAEVDAFLTELLDEHARPVIRGIIRNKLDVTLSPSDGRHENQEAIEIESDVLAELLIELNELKAEAGDKVINNFRSYVAVITFHACYKYFRRKHPQRGQLKDKLRYLLNSRPRFSLWQTSDEQWVCGFTEWQAREPQIVRAGQLNRLLSSSPKNSPGQLAVGDVNAGTRLEEIIPAVLNRAGRPVEFDELVDAIAELQGIKKEPDKRDVTDEGDEEEMARVPDPRPDVEAEADQRFYLQRLWAEICQLPLRQRAALMLNLKDTKGRGMISLFPLMGIAGVQQIAAALEMQPERFAELWNDLPWEDAQIAEHLSITRQQVVNLRKCARERLSRRMKGF